MTVTRTFADAPASASEPGPDDTMTATRCPHPASASRRHLRRARRDWGRLLAVFAASAAVFAVADSGDGSPHGHELARPPGRAGWPC